MSITLPRPRALVAIAAVGTVALLLGGCAATPSEQTVATAGPVPAEETTLTVWSFLPSNFENGGEAYAELVDTFEEMYPQVTVKIVDQPYPTYFDQLRNATVARKGPDVVTMYGAAQAYNFRNALLPMQDALEPEVEESLRFIPETKSEDGNLYTVPVGSYGYTVMANEEVLASVGLSGTEALSSWDSLLSACAQLSSEDITPFAAGWKDGFLLETYMYMFTAQLMDADMLGQFIAGEISMDDPVFADAVDYIVDMEDANCFGGEEALDRTMYTDSFDQFEGGKSAFGIGGNLDRVKRAEELIGTVSVLPFPQLPGSQFDAIIDAGPDAGWGVTRWTKSPEAAVAFVNFLASEQGQGILWEQIQMVPNIDGFLAEASTPAEQQFIDLVQMPDNHTGFAAFPIPALAAMERNAVPLISGDMSRDEFLTKAVDAAKAG